MKLHTHRFASGEELEYIRTPGSGTPEFLMESVEQAFGYRTNPGMFYRPKWRKFIMKVNIPEMRQPRKVMSMEGMIKLLNMKHPEFEGEFYDKFFKIGGDPPASKPQLPEQDCQNSHLIPEDNPKTTDDPTNIPQDMTWLVDVVEKVQSPLILEMQRKDEMINKLLTIMTDNFLGAAQKPEMRVETAAQITPTPKKKAPPAPKPDPSPVALRPLNFNGYESLTLKTTMVPRRASNLPAPQGIAHSTTFYVRGYREAYYDSIPGYITYKDMLKMGNLPKYISTEEGKVFSNRLAALCRKHDIHIYWVVDKDNPDWCEFPSYTILRAYPKELWEIVKRPLTRPWNLTT